MNKKHPLTRRHYLKEKGGGENRHHQINKNNKWTTLGIRSAAIVFVAPLLCLLIFQGALAEDIPVQATKDIPVEPAKEAPVQTEEETPVQAEKEAPVQAEEETPVQSEKETPVQAEEDVPVQAEQDVPLQAEQDAPVQPEKETPVQAKEIPVQPALALYQLLKAENRDLSLPSDVAVGQDRVYVVDGGNHRVVTYDQNEKFLFQFGGKGDQPGQLFYPVGIDIGKDGLVYVADSGNYRIQIFSSTGVFQSEFPVTDEDGTSVRPIDLVKARKRDEIIITGNNHSVLVYSKDGERLRLWGGNGLNPGQFRYPATIVEMVDNRVAVVDVLNSRLQIFNPSGEVSLVVADWGVLPGQLVRPKGVAVDRQKRFYISDSYMNVVQVYSETGHFLHVLGEDRKPYEFETAVGMAVDLENRIYICEMRKNRVSVYQLD